MSESMTLRARLAVPIKEVHHALTDAGALRSWLAEHAEIDLPHRYEFWGRYTPEGDAPHQRPLHVDDHTVRFSWLLDGEDTTVEIGLEEEEGALAEGTRSTILTLSQTHIPGWEDMIAEHGIRSVLPSFWSLAVANLADHLEGRELTPMCDFTSPDMREQILIGAPPDAVFDSLIDPEKFRQWFGTNIEIEPYVGGRWAMGSFELDDAPAKIVELEPGRKMTLAWEGIVAAWELEDSDGKTRLTFVQSGFDEMKPPYGAWMGWLSGVAELRRFHELSDWRPVSLAFTAPGMPEGIMATD
ncbi:MAG: SRPBCC family protein [Pseudonocardiaceae bacterium]